MRTKQQVMKSCLTFPGTYEDYPFDEKTPCMRRRDNQKIFALIMERQGQIWVNVKCSPEWIEFWRGAFDAVVPGFHMNKKHWNSIILDGTIPDKDILRMLGESYDLTAPVGKKKKRGEKNDCGD